MPLCVFLNRLVKHWQHELNGIRKAKSNQERATQKLLDILDNNEQAGLIGLVRRFVPVAGKTIAQVVNDLAALDNKYAAYQSDLIRIIQYSRGKVIFSERQIARQAEIDLYYFVCYQVAQLQKWLEAGAMVELAAGYEVAS